MDNIRGRRLRSKRSRSPNTVLINGEIVDKEQQENVMLYNIIEESDCAQSEFNRKDHKSVNRDEQQDSTLRCPIIKEHSQEEFNKFLALMDEKSKNKIIDILVNVYKKDILSQVSTELTQDQVLNQSQEKIDKFKKVCEDIISKASSAETVIIGTSKKVNFQLTDDVSEKPEKKNAIDEILKLASNFQINYHVAHKMDSPMNSSLEDFIDKKLGSHFENPFRPEVFDIQQTQTKEVYANLPPVRKRHSQEQEINRLLGRKCKPPIGGTEHMVINKNSNTLKENKLTNIKHLISEGIQAGQQYFEDKSQCFQKVDFVKPYKYQRDLFFESQSDIAINCPFGCPLHAKRSKSDTDFSEDKNKRQKKSSLIEITRKSSLLEMQNFVRKNQMINFTDKAMKRDDSSEQFSQVIFETSNQSMDHDTSVMEIPTVDPKQIDNFNANYLLHSLKIATQSKTDVVPKVPIEHLTSNVSQITVSEEDYRKWLQKQNWVKYSNPLNELPSIGDLRSISQVIAVKRMKDRMIGDQFYYLDRGDFGQPSSVSDQPSHVLGEFGEIFLYEHAVLSNAMNFLMTINAKRTRVLSRWDRFLQVLFLCFFYYLWYFFDNYVYMEPIVKKRNILWK